MLRVGFLASLALLCAVTSFAAVSDLPGMDTANSMKEWMKLTDQQVAQLEPVIDTRVTKMDAALTKLEGADEPNIEDFIKERKVIMDEFNAGVTKILNPDQLKQWESFKAEVEKTLVHEGAVKKLSLLQEPMDLTEEQMTKLEAPMVTATQGQLDVLQKLANTGRIGLRDKKQAGSALKGIDAELQKSMSAILSPSQIETYQKIKAELKEARKAAKKG
jgi:hypothetical protein